MAKKIDIRAAHALPPAEVQRRVRAFEGFALREYDVNAAWLDGRTVALSGPVVGTLWIQPSEIIIVMELGFAAGFFAGRIETGIRSKLTEVLAHGWDG